MQNMNSIDKINDFYDGITFNPVLIIFIVVAVIGFWLLVKRKELWIKVWGAILFLVSFCTMLMLFEFSNPNLLM